jgi:hypothetical protein
MSEKEPNARRQSQSRRDKEPAEAGKGHNGHNGHNEDVEGYAEELAGYLQRRIKPGLNRGSIPLLARSVAKEIAQEETASYEQELLEYLQERIKPGLNSGAIPLLARSIAKDIAQRALSSSGSDFGDDDAEPSGSAQVQDTRSDDDDGPVDFEAEMHELQADLGEDWILRFSVHGDDAWLTAEKEDGSQRIEAETADVLYKAVKVLNKASGRSG